MITTLGIGVNVKLTTGVPPPPVPQVNDPVTGKYPARLPETVPEVPAAKENVEVAEGEGEVTPVAPLTDTNGPGNAALLEDNV